MKEILYIIDLKEDCIDSLNIPQFKEDGLCLEGKTIDYDMITSISVQTYEHEEGFYEHGVKTIWNISGKLPPPYFAGGMSLRTSNH